MALFELKESNSEAASCAQFLLSHYTIDSPSELIVSHLDDPQAVAQALTNANGAPIQVTVPYSGVKLDLLRLCECNCAYRVSRGDSG